MKDILKNIIGQEIHKVFYSEINHPKGEFYFEGFDTFDGSLNIQMKNDYWWHLSWKDEEYFEFDKGKYTRNQYFTDIDLKTWDATERWNSIIDKKVSDFKIQYFDEARLFLEKITIIFENNDSKTILINEELNLNGSITYPVQFDLSGEIYVFHDKNLLKEK